MSNAEIFGIFKKAAKLTKDPSNGCRVVFSMRHFALPPRYLGRLKQGVKEVLEAEIGRYSESLHAVPLAFCDLQLLQNKGNILDDQPHIHFDVTFKAVVFQPAIGSVLKCVVNEFAGDHVSCLVHNWFNLSLPLRGPDVEQRLARGSKVTAKVTCIRGKNGILAIQGFPTDERFADLQVNGPESENAEEVPQSDDSAPRKQKHDSGFFSDPEESIERPLESQPREDDQPTNKKKKKKKKERKSDEVEMEENVQRGEDTQTSIHIGASSVSPVRTIKTEMSDNANKFERADVSGQGDNEISSTLDMSVEGIPPKKKKKKKKKLDQPDQDVFDIVIKKESFDDDVSCEVVESQMKTNHRSALNTRKETVPTIKQEPADLDESSAMLQSSGKKKKKKRESETALNDESSRLTMKEEIVVDCDQSFVDETYKKEKRKKKRKEGSRGDLQEEDIANSNTTTLDNDEGDHSSNTLSGTLKIKKEPVSCDLEESKKMKRKRKADHSVGSNVNGSGDGSPRTTQIEVDGTEEEFNGAPPAKKKKKHKRERESL